jgi:hypothetical protein
MQFMEYCMIKYGKEMILSKWVEFCEEHHIERFIERAIDAALNDEQLYNETLLFARDIGELARQTA